MSQRGHTSRLPTEKGGFTSNRTRATNRNTPFPLPEAQSKATENDGRDRSCAEKKGGEIRPVGTISREVMRHFLALLAKDVTCKFGSFGKKCCVLLKAGFPELRAL